MINKRVSILTLCVAAVVSAKPYAGESAPSLEELWALVQQQQAEIAELKQKLSAAEDDIDESKQQLAVTVEAVEQSVASQAALPASARWVEKTSIGGYGEHHLNINDGRSNQIDAHRFVVYIGHQFNDKLRFFSELELEHGLSGDGKPGEVELEQAFIEYDFAERHSIQLGQFLLPVGLLNETHEPETFYGVERNLVEKNIIPTTWWETGAMLKGELAEGWQYNLAIHSGLAAEPGGTLRGGRQKSAEAVADDWAYTGRIKYTAIPGLELAASLQYQGNLTQGADTDASAVLTEFHAAYQQGKWGLRALWANWDVDGVSFAAAGTDQQRGWYLEPSYKITDKLGVFARYSTYNNAAGLASSDDAEFVDYGFNYWLSPQVVVKADVSDDRNGLKDSINLGVGWSY